MKLIAESALPEVLVRAEGLSVGRGEREGDVGSSLGHEGMKKKKVIDEKGISSFSVP